MQLGYIVPGHGMKGKQEKLVVMKNWQQCMRSIRKESVFFSGSSVNPRLSPGREQVHSLTQLISLYLNGKVLHMLPWSIR